MADAETRYWKLAVSRELIHILEESTSGAIAIRDYNVRKVSRHLADVSEVLAAEAAVQGRQLVLKRARDDERAAARAFNSGRSIDSDTVAERLEVPSLNWLQNLPVPERAEMRDDVKASEQAELATLNLERDTTFKIAIKLVVPLDSATTSAVRAG